MMLELLRLSETREGTIGCLRRNGTLWLFTLELPWSGNATGESCIPEGGYECGPHVSQKFGRTYEVLNVPGRSEILFHPGNTIKDTHGCILLGEYIRGPWLYESRKAFVTFKTYVDSEVTGNFPLIIKKI